jgi:uroporphyrinogen decarboxylase
MNPVETYFRTLKFQPVDRVLHHEPTYEAHYFGANHEGFDWAQGDDSPVGSRWTDIWGTGWHKLHPGVMGMPEMNPLADPSNLDHFSWPDADDERVCMQIYRMAEAYQNNTGPDQRLLVGSHRDTLWEKAYMLVGMENMMMYFISEPDYAREILHRIMDFQLGMAQHYLKVGIRLAQLGDDLGTQIGPLLGPRIVNEFLVPEYRRLIALYQRHGVLIGFHSCGHLGGDRPDSLLNTFMALGVDVLNPVQATANNLDLVRRVTQGRMALRGGVSSGIVMDGPVERIEAEVCQRLWQLGRAGGYICSPDQGMPYPEGHVQAVENAVEKYGVYPIVHP